MPKASIYAYLSIRWKSEFQNSNVSIRICWLMPKTINEMQTKHKKNQNGMMNITLQLICDWVVFDTVKQSMFSTSFTIFVIGINQNVNHLISSNNAVCSVFLYAQAWK